jgi:hypothetical protein
MYFPLYIPLPAYIGWAILKPVTMTTPLTTKLVLSNVISPLAPLRVTVPFPTIFPLDTNENHPAAPDALTMPEYGTLFAVATAAEGVPNVGLGMEILTNKTLLVGTPASGVAG